MSDWLSLNEVRKQDDIIQGIKIEDIKRIDLISDDIGKLLNNDIFYLQ
jgi:hypothetical protein